VRQIAEPVDFGGDIKRPVMHGGQAEFATGGQTGSCQVFVLILDGYLVHAIFRRLACPTETDVRAGQSLQFQGDVFQDMGQIGAALQPLEEPAALADAASMLDQAGKPGRQSLVEAGNHLGRQIFEFAQFDPGFQDGKVCPDVRSTQRQYLPKFHVKLLAT
jgi:hypothetical protein